MNQEISLKARSEIHLIRRVWHVLCGVIGLGLYFSTNLTTTTWACITLAIAIAGFFLDFKRLRSDGVNTALKRVFQPIMRKSEEDGFSGLPFYSLGVALTLFFYDEKVAILAIMFLVFADPIASVFGVYFGRDKILPNKTYQGTVAAFITCYFITLGYQVTLGGDLENVFLFAFVGGVFGSSSELLGTFNIDDNFTIPILSGLGLSIFSQILGCL